MQKVTIQKFCKGISIVTTDRENYIKKMEILLCKGKVKFSEHP